MDLTKYFGNYRAKVLKNHDENFFGRILLWIPDIMPDIEPIDNDTPQSNGSTSTISGLWAYPANNPLGGRSDIENEDQWGQGSCYVPKIGSYVWVFFEGGNINRPWYFGSCDIETSKVLPENQVGDKPENKWTIFKSSQGRCIIISDDCDERIEITGKKRQLEKSKEKPEGDIDSVFTIDHNQTTILLEETDGNEKLLIRTYKGDYINVDITKRELHCEFKNDIYFKTQSDFYVEALNIHMKAKENMYLTAEKEIDIVGRDNAFFSSNGQINISGKQEVMVHSTNTSIVGENLFLTGNETIHQSTSLNLIGGKINVGLVIPRKITAMPGREAGEAGEASSPNPYGLRATNKDCSEFIPPDTKPDDGTVSVPPEEMVITPDDQEPPTGTFDSQNDGSLIPDNTEISDIFDRDEVSQ